MAAWRYGDQFGRRRRTHLLWTGAGVAAVGGVILLGPVAGLFAGSTWGLWNVASTFNSLYQQRRVRARVLLPDRPEPVNIRLKQLGKAAIVADEGEWALRVAFESGLSHAIFGNEMSWAARLNEGSEMTALIRGDAALRAASKILPAVNRSGAKRGEVDSAVRIIGDVAEPSKLFERYAARPIPLEKRRSSFKGPSGHVLANLPTEVRLALEMATHEESERRALEGELAVLEAAWREAEEIASIADDMFVSEETRSRLAALKNDGQQRS
jgi:hypothetical protein